MATITVRQATISDLDALVPLFDGYRQFYQRTSDLAAARTFLMARFAHAESTVFLAHEAEVPLGFTQLFPSFSSVSLSRVFILNDLFVHPHARRKGVGKSLVAAATEYAKSLGAVRLTLSTALANKDAQALYQSVGWRRDEQFAVYHLAVQG